MVGWIFRDDENLDGPDRPQINVFPDAGILKFQQGPALGVQCGVRAKLDLPGSAVLKR